MDCTCRKLTQVDYSTDLHVSNKKMIVFLACKNVAISFVYTTWYDPNLISLLNISNELTSGKVMLLVVHII